MSFHYFLQLSSRSKLPLVQPEPTLGILAREEEMNISEAPVLCQALR